MTGSPNPFVGPRPFEFGEQLWGRDWEICELDNLLSAERIVLLHSPSGAGKSSLVQAGLLPRVKKSFDVWGPTRLNQEPRDDLKVNRYVLSAVAGLEEGIPERLRRPPEVLAGQTLREYLEARPRRRSASENVLLVVDQFEEILTVDPLAVEAKREFFDQLGDLLHNSRVWALFALREDYLAPLDPYARQVPTHLKNRFRIDLLGLDGAREAMVNPAREGGREFPAAEQLVHDLATMKVQQADGSFREETGRHVEPVQLQVACLRLWNEMPDDARSIEAEDLEQFGDVTEALAGYYADSVTRISGGTIARERAIRDWFGEALITAGGIRGQVLRGADESEGLANAVIERLLDTHLVRAEKRAGATWYELAHDRLIEPVRSDNAAWRGKHLSEAQQRATLWESQGRPPGLLLTGEELAAAERWAEGSVVTTNVELRFLEESRQAQTIADRERRQARRIKRLGIAAIIVGALALVASAVAVQQMVEANQQRQAAVQQREAAVRQREEAVRLSKEAESQRQRAEREKDAAEAARKDSRRQEHIAIEQKDLAERREQEAQIQRDRAESAGKEADEASRVATRAKENAEQQQRFAVEQKDRADKQRAKAVAAEKATARLRRVAEAEALALRVITMKEEADQQQLPALLAVAAHRLNLLHGGEAENPQIYAAMLLAFKQLFDPLSSARGQILYSHDAAVRSLALMPGGHILAFGTEDGEIHLIDMTTVDLSEPKAPRILATEVGGGGVRSLAFGPEGRLLAAGTFNGSIRVWAIEELLTAPRILIETGLTVNALAFAPGALRLAAGDSAGTVRLWDLAAATGEPTVLAPGEVPSRGGPANGASREDEIEAAAGPQIRSLAFSPVGAALAAGSGRGLLLWDLERFEDRPRQLSDKPVRSVAISRDGRYLAAGKVRPGIELWDLQRLDDGPEELLGHTAWVEDLEFHPHRNLLVSASFDASLRIWDVDRQSPSPLVLEGHDSWLRAVVFTSDGRHLISAASDRTLRLWITTSEGLAAEICRTARRNLTHDEWREYLPDVGYEEICPDLLPETIEGEA